MATILGSGALTPLWRLVRMGDRRLDMTKPGGVAQGSGPGAGKEGLLGV